MSAIEYFLIVTFKVSGRSRFPPQEEQLPTVMYFCISVRIYSDFVSLYLPARAALVDEAELVEAELGAVVEQLHEVAGRVATGDNHDVAGMA